MSGQAKDGCVLPKEQLCGCCSGVDSQTPQLITNRPALSSIAYRAGTYSTFNASMLAALSDPAFPALSQLRTRSSSDFSIALLDSWAVALDILTFYQERLANKAFLRTADDQRSVFELARLVGYVPSPGVSASAVLAFTLSSATGSPDNVRIPAGTRVQSVPGPGEKPQVFETSSDLVATIAANAIPAQTTIPWQLFGAGADTSTWIRGSKNNINVGDALLFLTASAGQPIVDGPGDLHFVTAVTIDPVSGNTQIFWDQPLSSSFNFGMTTQDASIFIFRKKAGLYGVQAPNPLTLGDPNSNGNLTKILGYPATSVQQNGATTVTTVLGKDWVFSYAAGSKQINLDASYAGLAPGQGATAPLIVLTSPERTAYFQVKQAVESNPGLYTLTTKTTQLTLDLGNGISGKVASSAGNLNLGSADDLQDPTLLDDLLTAFVQDTRSVTAYVQSMQLTPTDLPLTAPNLLLEDLNVSVPLANGMIFPVQGASISVVGGQRIAANQPIGISGKRVRLKVLSGSQAVFVPSNSAGVLQVTDNQTFVVASFPATSDPVSGNPSWQVVTVTGVSGTLAVPTYNSVLLPAETKDPLVSEAAVVNAIGVAGDITTLSLVSSLNGLYDATTVTVNANAVEATHGETVVEILGNGDATNGDLEFTLKQSPLTYVTAPSRNGSQSTLEVWVNNLRWHEVPNLLSSGPAERVFVTCANAKGSTIVQFGNGVQGARTPTGQANLRAVYRKGIGAAGMVKAGQLSQPLDRPQGLTNVVNPSPASGGADSASADDARARAPLPTLTIGRVVSLEDYQNFALAFAGIAKALATWTWFGNVRGVFLTVAGDNGAVLQNDDPIFANLIQAVRAAGNPYVPLRVVPYVPVLFQFTANVNIDTADYDPKQVLADVWQNVLAEFAFDVRRLGQNVVAGEIIETIQSTPGVIAVQLAALSPSGQPAGNPVPAVLCAAGPLPPQGAQMLQLDPQTQGNIGVWS